MAWTTTAAILTNYTEALKTYFLPAVQDQLNHDTILADKIDTNEEDVFGLEAKIEMHYGRNTGTGARADAAALPTPGKQAHKQATVPMKYNYGTITVTGPTIAATRDQRGAWSRAVDNEVTGCVRDLQKEINRQLWGCGYGILARWRTTGSGTSYTIQKKYFGNSAGGDGFGSAFGAKYLKVNGNTSGVPVVLTTPGASGVFAVDETDVLRQLCWW